MLRDCKKEWQKSDELHIGKRLDEDITPLRYGDRLQEQRTRCVTEWRWKKPTADAILVSIAVLSLYHSRRVE